MSFEDEFDRTDTIQQMEQNEIRRRGASRQLLLVQGLRQMSRSVASLHRLIITNVIKIPLKFNDINNSSR